MPDTQKPSSLAENHPRQALIKALAQDLEPLVKVLRAQGWDAEVWLVKEDGIAPFHAKVMIPLDHIPQPAENTEVFHEEPVDA